SMPAFWMGLILIMFFAVRLKWLPTGGDDGFKSLVLPAITLGMSSMAIIARMTRSSVLEVDRREYVRTARAKGLTRRLIISRHMLRLVLIPVATSVGLILISLVNGALFIELIFSIPGFGKLTIQGVQQVDYPVIMATVIIGALIVMVGNMLIDLVYPLLDPRITRS
ncbi:MAG: ABC transporter permease, partial [Caldilineaceae bacterium]|nr:ABC transporter permease [Caldilineaceae bacterium]